MEHQRGPAAESGLAYAVESGSTDVIGSNGSASPDGPADPAPVRPSTVRRRVTDVPVLLQLCVHLLVATLLALAVAHALTSGPDRAPLIIAVSIGLGVAYGLGPAVPAVRKTVSGAGIWLACVLALWLALLVMTPDAIWLAFPWFFLLAHLLPWRFGLPAVALTTAAAIGGFAWHQGTVTAGTAIGPILGALVAVVTVWGYTSLAAESDRRRMLIAELRRTRAELATAERSAGAMVERERLAREIHDTLTQGLSSIQLLLRAAARSLPETGTAPAAAVAQARQRIEHAREAAQDNLAEARRFVSELAPPGLQGRCLSAALDRLCRTTTDRTGLPVRFTVVSESADEHPSPALPTAVEVALLRIAQSALANVSAHADASWAAVTLTGMDGAVALDIVDDGVGFDPKSPPVPPAGSGGFGLSAMRSRVSEFGGTLSVESAPGEGAAIAVIIPLPQVPTV